MFSTTVCVSVVVRNIVACFIERRYKFKGVISNYVLFALSAQNEPMMAKCLFARRFLSETTEAIYRGNFVLGCTVKFAVRI
jgi:hypothetical protein